MLRVLYLWNTAGALTPVADLLLETGNDARILMSTKYDLFGNTFYSDAALMVDSPAEYHKTMLHQLVSYKPTHIHVNQSLESLSIARLLCPTTPIVFQYHGTEVRFKPHAHPEVVLADKVLVSTPDLQQYGEWYDRPVSEMFTYKGGRRENTAVMFYAPFFDRDSREEALEWCKEHDVELTIKNRAKGEGIPYMQMPSFLSSFEYLLDYKGVIQDGTLSRVAIEALSCGCKVVSDIDPTNIITTYEFPKAKKFIDLYHSLERPSFSVRRQLISIAALIKWSVGRLY